MRLITLHDILIAWREGRLTIEQSLEKAKIDTEDELREAAMLSGVLPMRPLTDEEREHQEQVNRILAQVGEDPIGATG